MWPDPETAVIGLLQGRIAGVHVADTVPGEVESEYPEGFIRVTRGAGSDDGITDSPLMDLEAFHPDRIEAARIADEARQVMLGAVNQTGVLFDRIQTISTPAYVFYGPNIERYVATYQVDMRRPYSP